MSEEACQKEITVKDAPEVWNAKKRLKDSFFPTPINHFFIFQICFENLFYKSLILKHIFMHTYRQTH